MNRLRSCFLRRVLPARLRFALCLMVGAYPLISAILTVLGPVIGDWPLLLRSLVIVPLMVSGMVFGVIPMVHRLAHRWIAAGAPHAETA